MMHLKMHKPQSTHQNEIKKLDDSPLLNMPEILPGKLNFDPLIKRMQPSSIGPDTKVEFNIASALSADLVIKEIKIDAPCKTPVSVLQEILCRKGISPNYELLQVEGAIHEPTFRYQVTVGGFVANGTGRSKKEAKHSAAKSLLEMLQLSDSSAICGLPSSVPEQCAVDTTTGNPIGVLQELCMSRRWPPPAYKTEYEEGLPHDRKFTISCMVYKYKETGTGKSKKIAKRIAAQNMCTRLKNLREDEEINSEELSSGESGEWEKLKSAKLSNGTAQQAYKVSQFHKNLKSAEGPNIEKLQVLSLDMDGLDFLKILQEIALEQKFEITYVDIEEKSFTGKYQCLVQLSTIPVAVCHGTGDTKDKARVASAHHALHYLKIMAKK